MAICNLWLWIQPVSCRWPVTFAFEHLKFALNDAFVVSENNAVERRDGCKVSLQHILHFAFVATFALIHFRRDINGVSPGEQLYIPIVEGKLKTMGLVLNKPLKLLLHEIVTGVKIEENIPVFCGGPVGAKSLFYIHNIEEVPQSLKITKNLYLGGDFDWLMENLNAGLGLTGRVRFFLGYSGWDEGQLTEEINQQSWLVSKISTEEILHLSGYDTLWARSM